MPEMKCVECEMKNNPTHAHDEMENYVIEHLLAILPPDSVIVVDSAY
jgi:hypothetical protein